MPAPVNDDIARETRSDGLLQLQLEHSQRQAMQGMDVPWLLDQWAERSPDKPFIIWEPFVGETTTWSYARFRADARAFAAVDL